MKQRFILILIYVFLLLKPINLLSIEPDVFIQSTVNRAAQTLSGNFTKQERIQKLKEIAKETVDIEGISLYSLGAYRKTISDEKLDKYKSVFKNYFLKSFSSRLAEYTNPEIDVYGKKKINDKYTIVNSILLGTDTRPEVKIDWRVYTRDPDNLLIRDLIIEGLSLARTQKEEFSSIINSNNGDVEALIKNLANFSNQ
ncbi:ABC transporter substrate-binding protein [Candidatus Pelagibacter sp.]|nr:ABC transporter substrate-binding protein [Candidatus Pelagibacter sp.]